MTYILSIDYETSSPLDLTEVGAYRYAKAAKIMCAAQLTGLPILSHHILLIMVAVKLARMSTNPRNLDHFMDAINYLAFAGELLTEEQTNEPV